MSPAPKQRFARMYYARDREIYQTERPYKVLSAFDGSCNEPQTNLDFGLEEPEVMNNIRGRESAFGLDQHGFQYVTSPTQFERWEDRRLVEEQYLPEMRKFLLDTIEGAEEVVIFDWRLRSSNVTGHLPDMNNPTDTLGVATQVHLDQSASGVLKRIRLLMGDRADALLQGRVQCINAWRPLTPVENWPLAVCDGASITSNDLLEVDLIRKDYIGSTMFSKFRPGYQWYYLENQSPAEVCLFKNFDSKQGVNATVCPHASFLQEDATCQTRPRQSIEVRTFIFGR